MGFMVLREAYVNTCGFDSQKMLINVEETLDLADLPRSTLCESVSAFAALTVEEVVANLGLLNWQECCVTSVETLRSYHGGGGQRSLLAGSSSGQILHLTNAHNHARKTKRMDEIYGVVLEPVQRSRLSRLSNVSCNCSGVEEDGWKIKSVIFHNISGGIGIGT